MKRLFYTLLIVTFISSCDESDDGGSKGSNVGINLSIDYPQSINPGQLITIEMVDPNLESFSFNITPNSIPSNAKILDSDGNDITAGITGSYPEMKEITFSVTEEGSYNFNMSIDNESWTSTISFSANGCYYISSDEFLALGNIEKRVLNGVDYCIIEEITIPTDQSVSINSEVIIQLGKGAGFIINGTLNISQANLNSMEEEGWKGILINDGGTLNTYGSTISEAGFSAFSDNQKAVIINDGTLSMSGDYISTTAEGAYGVYFLDNEFSSNTGSTTTTISAEHAVYGGLDDFLSLNAHLSGSGYSTIIGDGELTSIAGTGSNIFFGNGAKINFSGSVQFGQSVNLQSNEITMEADQSLIFSSGIQSSNSTISGKDGAKWKGVYLNGTNNNFNSMTIEDAGSDFINISGNPLPEKTAVYVAGHLTSFTGCTISGSGGYGLYLSSFVTAYSSISGDNNTFDNNSDAAIAGPLDLVYKLLHNGSSAKTTTFTNSTAESVKLFAQTSATPSSTGYFLPGLGSGNYYLLDENLIFNENYDKLTLLEGVHIKVSSGKGIQFSNTNHSGWVSSGTSSNPVIIEAADATAGWNGIHLQGTRSTEIFTLSHTTVSGAGLLSYVGVQAGNIAFNSSTALFNFTDCTIKDSKSYGVIIGLSSNSVDFGDSSKNNSFSGNASGDIYNENI
ncbi:hypothetical protein [Reichenbachiella sp.]|uniref:hypothetical protein n=1 Tax=Reichenbachiella sp. TaxID=2184521 RepID=UPI003B5AF49D